MTPRIFTFLLFCTLALTAVTGLSTAYSAGNNETDTTRLVVFCDEIDDNWSPVNPTTRIKAGSGVNFLVKLKDGLAVPGMVWDIYKVGHDGKDAEPFNNLYMSSSDPEQKFRYWGTTEKTFFTDPGTYRVYIYPKNMNSDYYKSGNWENYSAKGELIVE